MPVYRYRAADVYGGVRRGALECADEASAKDALRAAGLLPIELVARNFFTDDFPLKNIFNRKLGANELSQFLSKLSFALEAGVRLSGALGAIRSSGGNARLTDALFKIESGIEAGESFSGALRKQKTFPEIVPGMAEIGEKSGKLPEVLSRLSEFYETETKLTDELKQAMIYPAAVSAAILAVIIVSVTFVLPGYARVFAFGGAELPLPTKLLLGAGVFLSSHYALILILLFAAAAAAAVFLNGKAGRYFLDACKLKLPLVSKIYILTMNMRFSYILSILSGSGVPLAASVGIISGAVGNAALAPVMDGIARDVGAGESLSAAMTKSNFFDPLTTGMIAVGEETGRLPETVMKASEFLCRELSRLTGGLNKLVEPLITIILGLILAFVMLAVMLPSFALTGVI